MDRETQELLKQFDEKLETISRTLNSIYGVVSNIEGDVSALKSAKSL